MIIPNIHSINFFYKKLKTDSLPDLELTKFSEPLPFFEIQDQINYIDRITPKEIVPEPVISMLNPIDTSLIDLIDKYPVKMEPSPELLAALDNIHEVLPQNLVISLVYFFLRVVTGDHYILEAFKEMLTIQEMLNVGEQMPLKLTIKEERYAGQFMGPIIFPRIYIEYLDGYIFRDYIERAFGFYTGLNNFTKMFTMTTGVLLVQYFRVLLMGPPDTTWINKILPHKDEKDYIFPIITNYDNAFLIWIKNLSLGDMMAYYNDTKKDGQYNLDNDNKKDGQYNLDNDNKEEGEYDLDNDGEEEGEYDFDKDYFDSCDIPEPLSYDIYTNQYEYKPSGYDDYAYSDIYEELFGLGKRLYDYDYLYGSLFLFYFCYYAAPLLEEPFTMPPYTHN
jgi:hypothetical protein